MKTIIVDLDKCNGCYNCQLACKDEHCENDWRPIAAPQPQTGQFWCRVDEQERGRVPVVRVSYTPRFCGHCDECSLLDVAPECVYRNGDGFIIIDPEKAKGRHDLVDACRQNLVFWNEQLDIPQKCTGCSHLLDNGWSQPRCVDSCATGALRFGEEEDFENEIAQAHNPYEGGKGPHVRYLNVPKRWIAGIVVDRDQNEVVVGARVEIEDDERNVVAHVTTGELGSFSYESCDPLPYRVHIEAEGFRGIDLDVDCTHRDVVLNDVFLRH